MKLLTFLDSPNYHNTLMADTQKPVKNGGTRKISDLPKQQTCRHPQHNPAAFRVYKPGIYEHTCPACGATIKFTVPAIIL